MHRIELKQQLMKSKREDKHNDIVFESSIKELYLIEEVFVEPLDIFSDLLTFL